MYYPKLKERPPNFRINRGVGHPLAKGCVFAMLGRLSSGPLAYDSSAYGDNGVLTNMDPATAWTWMPKLNRLGVKLDGVDDYVQLNLRSLPFTKPCSLAFWLQWPSSSWRKFFAVRGNESGWTEHQQYTNAEYWGLDGQGDSSSGYIRVHSGYGNSNQVAIGSSGGTISHIVVLYKGGSVFDIYGNGIFRGSANMLPYTGNSGDARIAYDGYGPPRYSGRWSDTLVFSRLLAPSEISVLADPDNVDLRVGGVPLILPPKRVWWPAVTAPITTKKTPWHLMIQGAI